MVDPTSTPEASCCAGARIRTYWRIVRSYKWHSPGCMNKKDRTGEQAYIRSIQQTLFCSRLAGATEKPQPPILTISATVSGCGASDSLRVDHKNQLQMQSRWGGALPGGDSSVDKNRFQVHNMDVVEPAPQNQIGPAMLLVLQPEFGTRQLEGSAIPNPFSLGAHVDRSR